MNNNLKCTLSVELYVNSEEGVKFFSIYKVNNSSSKQQE